MIIKKTISILLLTIAGIAYSTPLFADCNSFVKWAMQIKHDNNIWLGQPKTDFKFLPGGCYRHYDNGSIYATPAEGAWEVHGAIRTKWSQMGWEKSILGYPTTDEMKTPDGVGRYNHFQGGSIYWHPCIGAHEVHGEIRRRWAAMGWEKSILGYPKSDETKTSDGVGRFNIFQHGAIYYHPTHGTHSMHGAIYYKWLDEGGENGKYGYPTSEPNNSTYGYYVQGFENGSLNMTTMRMEEGFNLQGEIARRGIETQTQGDRPTCSVFAMTFLLEFGYTNMCGSGYANLSEEYLNHVTNIASGKTDDGDFFENIADGYNTYGIVPETSMPYKDFYQYYSINDLINNNDLMNAAGWIIQLGMKLPGRFIKPNDGTKGLSVAQEKEIRDYLERGIPVAIGRSHSQVIVAYMYPEEGGQSHYYILKDSGAGGGYVRESMRSVNSTVNDVYVYDPIKN